MSEDPKDVPPQPDPARGVHKEIDTDPRRTFHPHFGKRPESQKYTFSGRTLEHLKCEMKAATSYTCSMNWAVTPATKLRRTRAVSREVIGCINLLYFLVLPSLTSTCCDLSVLLH